jgi:hypothetical protein
MYTAQQNAHGNIIVCKGSEVRNSYRIIYTGSYNECMAYKFEGARTTSGGGIFIPSTKTA